MMRPFYDRVLEDMKNLNHVYKTVGTKIIAEGQRMITFQYRLQKTDTLLGALIKDIGWFHILKYRRLHHKEHPKAADYETKRAEDLTAMALYNLCLAAPPPLLKCLDFNYRALLNHFGEHFPVVKNLTMLQLNPLDKQCVTHAQ